MTRLIRDSQRKKIPKAVHMSRRKPVYGVGINDVTEVGLLEVGSGKFGNK